MGFRFRKSKSLFSGVKLNIGKSGLSLSLGPKGAKQSVSTTGRKTTSAGLPGTGLSYVKTSNKKKK